MSPLTFAIGLISSCAVVAILVGVGIVIGTHISRWLEIGGAKHRLKKAMIEAEHATILKDHNALLQLPTIATGNNVIVKANTHTGSRKC